MLIDKYPDFRKSLKGKTVMLTGAGGGIGYEDARAFAYMGATVIIAEIDDEMGTSAARLINGEFPESRSVFYEIDLADEGQIRVMYEHIVGNYGIIDVLFHNATIAPMGNVEEVPVEVWDKSYKVNFRAPLLLTQLFLPGMKDRDEGVVVFVPSSGAAPYMGAYEVFKTAQVELCNTLTGELEGTNVYVYSIGPGLVKTDTAMRSIEIVANRMGMTTDEFYAMNESHMLDAEEAGCGFAISVLSADKYNGQEIGSIQALLDSGLLADDVVEKNESTDYDKVIPLVHKVIAVFEEQYHGWMSRNIFERQWVLRDFKKTVGISAEQYKNEMVRLENELTTEERVDLSQYKGIFEKLKIYFKHQYSLLQGFEKDSDKLRENSDVIQEWIDLLAEIAGQI